MRDEQGSVCGDGLGLFKSWAVLIELPKGLHQLLCKVSMAEEQIVLQRSKMDHQFELFNEHFEEPLAGGQIGGVDGSFKASDVAIF